VVFIYKKFAICKITTCHPNKTINHHAVCQILESAEPNGWEKMGCLFAGWLILRIVHTPDFLKAMPFVAIPNRIKSSCERNRLRKNDDVVAMK